MFKRGEIVELNLKRMDGLIEVGILRDADHLISAHDGKVRSTAGYEMTKPPIHEKVGRRFVPSGEYREPLQDEWYLSGPIGEPTHAVLVPLPHYPILLPVPELEPEPEPEPEFEVGDWVKEDSGGFIYHINSFENDGTVNCDHCQISGQYFSSETFTKLPGRPLTTDDLMMAQSGRRVHVMCHADCCGQTKGIHGDITTHVSNSVVYFGHVNQPEPGYRRRMASYEAGAIVFADGVEGNIYVVSA